MRHFLSALAVAIVVVACSSAAPTETPAPSVSPTPPSIAPTTPPAAPATPSAPPEPTAAPVESPTPSVTGGLPSTAPNPFTGESAWIAYWGGGVGLVHPDGSGDHHIARDFGPGELALPNWSPDGTRLVTTSRDTGDPGPGKPAMPLYEYDLANDNVRQLFGCTDECLYEDDYPAYSPDGRKVVFVRRLAPFVYSEAQGEEVPADCGLWIGDIASGEVTQVTSNTDPPCDQEYFPRWSPDGSRLAYWRDPYENGQPTGTAVFTISIDGSEEQRLTDPQMFAGDPDWSPDGQWIVFATYPLSEFNFVPKVSNLYRMHPDGSGIEQLTNYSLDQLRAAAPRYTPDGKSIVFTADIPEGGRYDQPYRHIWAIPADGGTPVVIAEQERIYTHPTWQPMPESALLTPAMGSDRAFRLGYGGVVT